MPASRSLARSPAPSLARSLALLAVLGAVTACGSSAPLEDADAEPKAIIDAWGDLACPDASVQEIDPGLLEGDEVARGLCELDITGTVTQKRQTITVLDSEAAVDTYLVDRDCDSYLYVTGPAWVASVTVRELATDLVEAGGELCKEP